MATQTQEPIYKNTWLRNFWLRHQMRQAARDQSLALKAASRPQVIKKGMLYDTLLGKPTQYQLSDLKKGGVLFDTVNEQKLIAKYGKRNAAKILDGASASGFKPVKGFKGFESNKKILEGINKNELDVYNNSLQGKAKALYDNKIYPFKQKWGGAATGLSLAYQGLTAGKVLGDYFTNKTNTDSFINDIKTEAYSNPMVAGQLDARNQKLLRQIQNGTYAAQNGLTDLGTGVGGALKALPKAALVGLGTGLVGGKGAGLVNFFGTLAKGGIENANSSRYDADLQGLYQQLHGLNQDYQAMRRPSFVRQAGLQNRYLNQLY